MDVSPDGQRLAIAGGPRNGRGVVVLLDAADWSIALSHSEQRAATCVAFSPAGDKLAIGTQIGEIAILDLQTQAVEHRWHSGSWAVFGITWTPNNRDVIAACANGLIKQFSADRGTLRTTFDTWQADAIPNPKLGGHSDRNLWAVMVSADGKTLLSGGWNGTTRLWNMASGEQEHAFTATDRSTQGVRFTADGRHFVSNGIHGNGTRVRATDSREVRAELDASGRTVAVHPAGEFIAASTFTDVQIFRLNLAEPSDEQRTQCRELLAQLASTDEQASTAAANQLRAIGLPAEVVLQQASRTATGELRQRIEQLRRELKSPAPVARLDGHDGEIRHVVYSPTGNFLATSTITGDVRIWNPDSFQLEHNLTLQLNP